MLAPPASPLVLVTGGSGLIGSFLIRHLLDRGLAVRALFRGQIPDLPFAERVEWVEGDILDVSFLREAMAGVGQLFHCAGLVSYAPQDAARLEQVNVDGTANIVNACLEAGRVKLCHVSSVAAIGRVPVAEVVDENAKWDPAQEHTAYARSKYFGELEVWRGVAEGLQAVIVNPSVVLGPAGWERSSTRLFRYVHQQHAFYTAGIGNFVDVRDVVEGMVRLMNADITGERFILNQGGLPYKDFFEQVAACWKVKAPSIRLSDPLAEVLWRIEHVWSLVTGRSPLITKGTARLTRNAHVFSNMKVTEVLGFSFRPLAETIRWCCENLETMEKKGNLGR